LLIDRDPPIVAFGPSSAAPHYFPAKESARKLTPNTFILIDIWTKLNQKDAPFADITWTGFYSDRVPEKVATIYTLVNESRDAALHFLQQELDRGELPTGQAVDKVSRDVIEKAGYGPNFTHSTGHSLGFTSPHGTWGSIRRTNAEPLFINLGYTIEPGVYLAGEFGVRTEMNFYIDDNYKIVLTTPVQSSLTGK
jgi:Xaa-Pro aminopeptidase